MGAKRAPHDWRDAEIARIAARTHGVVTARGLITAGVSRAEIEWRLRVGRLHRIHQGVFAVGHPALSREGRWIAAVFAAGAKAVLSHRSAAQLWGLLKWDDGPIHVLVPGRNGRRRRPGIRIHRPRVFDASDATYRQGIPATTVPRTINDLYRTEPRWRVRRAIRQAEVLGLPTGGAVSDRTRSDLERAFLEICRGHRVPPPEVNVRIAKFTVDFLWRDLRVVVEVDGYTYHRGRQAFRRDRDRDLELASLGFTVHRFADSRIADDPSGVGTAVRDLLARAGARFPR